MKEAIEYGSTEELFSAIVRTSLHDPCSSVLMDAIIDGLESGTLPIVEAAMTASSHVARLGCMTNKETVKQLIIQYLEDDRVADFAESILHDIDLFCE